MRKWMRDRNKRRNKSGQAPTQDQAQPQKGAEPLQPTFLDRDTSWSGSADEPTARDLSETPQPVYEAQPEADPTEAGGEDEAPAAAPQGNRRERSRRRGRGGRGRNRNQKAATLPIDPGQATGEAAEVDGVTPSEPETEPAAPKPEPSAKKETGKPKGAVVLAIGLPGSGKSSWFKRHEIVPLSSDLIRGLLFDDPTEQRFQDLVFSTLRSLLRARLIANRPMNYIDATNLSPKERHSWIRMAQDFNYEAHAVFFDVPTEICMERNRKRERNVPDEVMLRMAQKLRPPKFEEGFSKVTIVRLKKHDKVPEAEAAQPEAPAEEPEVPVAAEPVAAEPVASEPEAAAEPNAPAEEGKEQQ